MAMSSTTANWHWKNKNVTRWAKEWFERELISIVINGEKNGESVSISEVKEVDGDVELGQRKSKLITIFDCKIDMVWEGLASDGTEVKGTVVVPEVSHEVTVDRLSDYAYNWTLDTASSSPVDALYALAQSRLPTALEVKFAEFASAIIDTHGKDLTVSSEPSRSATPVGPTAASTSATKSAAPSTSTTTPAVPAKPVSKKAEQKPSLNKAPIEVEADFMAAASDLFKTFTDENAIRRWAGTDAQSTPEVGAGYSLYGGNVKGVYVSLTPHTEIVQTWMLKNPAWPEGHFAKLTTTLSQSTDSTKVKFSLADVPAGTQEMERNLERYYINALKQIGLGSML